MDNPYEQFRPTTGPWDVASPDYTPAQNGEPAKITVRPGKASADNPYEQFRPSLAGQAKALGVGAVQGASANLADEFLGALNAGVRGSGQTGNVTAGLAKLGYEVVTGQHGEAVKAYTEARDKWRGVVKQSEQDYPGTALAGNLLGGAAAPVGRALQAGTIAARAGRSAMVGAGYGGLAGFGEGEGAADSAVRAGAGAAVGGAVGGAAAPVAEGVLQAGRAVAAPVINTVRGIINPAGEASRRAGVAIARDAAIDPGAVNRLSPQEFGTNVQAGGPAMNMDVGGETTRALARSAANTSPEGRAVLNTAINDRFEGQGPRITNELQHQYNFPNALAQQEALTQAAQNANRPAYARAFREGQSQALWDLEFELIAQAPEVQNAIRIANPQLRNWAVRDGMRPPVNAFEIDGGRTTLRQTQSGNTYLPSLQYWDYVKRALDEMNTPTSRVFARTLRDKLDELVPSYQTARAGAAHFFGAQNALEAGQNYVTQNFANDATRQALGRMSPTERQLFQDGFVSRLIETLDRVGDRRNILNQIAANPAAREKLGIALGPQGAGQLEARLRVEGIMDLARTSVQGNSTTARQLVELGLAGGTAGYGYLQADPTAVMNAALVWGAARGHRVIDARVAEQVARMLTSNDPRMLTLGVQMVARNNNIMNALRTTDVALARVGAQQAPRPGMQSFVTSRADENSPEVPGPVH